MSRVNIVLTGPQGSGKTVIAKAIRKMLADNGIHDVVLTREDERDNWHGGDLLMVETTPTKLASLFDK